MSLIFSDSAGGSAIDTIQTISSATSTTATAWSSTVQAAFTAPGQTLSAAAISAADVGKTTTIVNTGANAFTLAQTGGSITSAIGLTVSPGATCALKAVSTTTSIIVGTNSNQGTIGEFGSISFATSGQQTLTTTVADLNQSTFTLPSAGTWEVTYTAHTFSVNNANLTVYVADNANTIVANSIGQINESSASQSFIPITKTVYITTAGAANYKLCGISSVAAAGGILANDTALRSNTISWKKISGFTPVTGQSVDTASVNLTGGNLSIPAVNTDVIFNTLAFGNIPYNTTTGVFVLTANKTYELECTLKSRGATAGYVQYEWVDAVSNVVIAGGINGLDIQAPSTLIEGSSARAYLLYTPTTNQTVKVRVTGVAGTGIFLDAQRCNANIKQIGSSAALITAAINDQTTSRYFDVGAMRMQWGRSTMGAGLTTVNLPVTFLNTNYTITGNGIGGASTSVIQVPTFNPLSTSQFTFALTFINSAGSPPAVNTGAQISWMAIGQKP